MEIANEIIDKFGGTARTAERFGLRDNTVSTWRVRGIPRSRHWQIIQEAGKDGWRRKAEKMLRDA